MRNRRPSFKEDLQKQIEDFARLTADGKHLCIAGDFNISFSDNYSFTSFGRDALIHSFAKKRVRLLTQNVLECIGHIAVSENFAGGTAVSVEEWNLEKISPTTKGSRRRSVRKNDLHV